MVSEIRLYIEGGGSSNHTRRRLRTGFSKFLSSIINQADANGIKVILSLRGPDSETCKAFCQSKANATPQTKSLLLIDSDVPVSSDQTDYSFIKKLRNYDIKNKDCHLMVQIMEAWFLADQEALRQFYGSKFNHKKLPGNTEVEEIDKDRILDGLKKATQETSRRSYHKIHHASDLLALINPDKVRQAAPHCERLLAALEELVAS